MSLMLDVPPAIVQDAVEYAQTRGLSLETLLREYVVELSQRKGRARLLGAASAYANPTLRSRERSAFRRAMEAKHASVC